MLWLQGQYLRLLKRRSADRRCLAPVCFLLRATLGQICLATAVVHQLIQWAPMGSINVSETESRGGTSMGIEWVSEMDVRFGDDRAAVLKGAIVHCDLVLPPPSICKWYSYSVLCIYVQHTYGALIGYMFSTFQRFLNFYLSLACLFSLSQIGKILWRRAWQPTPVFLPGESHGQRSPEGCSPWGHKELDTTERLTHTHTHTRTHTRFINST